MNLAANIPEVIAQQDAIINWSKTNECRSGYFCVLYRRMTLTVELAIKNKQFDDGSRMEKLIINFANFYLQAWAGYVGKSTVNIAWQQVFNAAEKNNLAVLQHLVLGINTHINLDLAKAAVQTCPGESIYALQKDFEKINNIIEALVQQMQSCLEQIWWPLKMLTDITNNQHKAVLNFSIRNARKASWANAVALAMIDGPAHNNHIIAMEKMVMGISEKIINPGWMTSALLKPVVWMEPKEVHKIIELLKE